MTLADVIPYLATAIGSGGVSAIGLALITRGERKDAQTAKATVASGREETARTRLANAEHAREDRAFERLHDKCREEVAELRDEVRTERDERLKDREALGRCEEKHAAVEERLERLERGSSRPPSMEPAE
jgi:hypothetical protein